MMHFDRQPRPALPNVRRGSSRRSLLLLAVVGVVAAVWGGTVHAGVFPDQAALTLRISDDFEDGVDPDGSSGSYYEWENVSTTMQGWQNNSTASVNTNTKGGSWGDRCAFSTGKSRSYWGYLIPKTSDPANAAFDATQWTNIQMEIDWDAEQTQSHGFIWAAEDADGDRNPERGYLFRILGNTPASTSYDDMPSTESKVTSGTSCAMWELRQITGENTYQVIGSSYINSNCLNPSNPTTTYTVSDATDVYTKYVLSNQAYRIRMSWFCGNLRVQIVRIYNPVGTDPPVYRGCGASCGDGSPGSGSTDPEDCWCTVVEWSPLPLEQPLDPGAAGLFGSGTWSTSVGSYHFVDNLKISSWDPDCGLVCGPWVGWGTARTDLIPFKLLYEGSLLDISTGRNFPDAAERGKIDINTEAPSSVSSYNHAADLNPYCNGWKLHEDLPDATDLTGNVEDIMDFLEPMTTAVDFESSGGSPPTFSWVENVDSSNPLPMIADGSTPINSSLLEAFDWYVDKKTNTSWATDQYESCRQWYVILITDGEEACEPSNPTAVCDAGGAAEKFKTPGITGVDALPVYTIGFSQSVAEDSPLKCIAEETGGTFMTAESQQELKDALYEVFYEIEDQTRSFAPFKVAPPPSSAGGTGTRDYLVVFPLFQPLDSKSLWSGNLWAFPLNEDQPHLPTIGDCEIDTTQMVWNAADALQDQLDAHTEGNPTHFVFMGSDQISVSGDWERYDLATMPDDTDLQDEVRSLLQLPASITVLHDQKVMAQQIVNFVRNEYMDSDFDSSNTGPPLDPRPDEYPVLGEFFHSQPVVVNPPNNLQYWYTYGFGGSTGVGIHNYGGFITEQAKRRRFVLAGSNDGMLHAFDAGFWDRDSGTGETYDQMHDLGDGTELFAWVPQAIMGSLYDITSGGTLNHTIPKYLVDGPIAKGDAFIDYDGSGDREWRTLALVSMRRGGRGILALDVTQPDPNSGDPDYIPVVSDTPGCRVGSTAGCDGEFPKVLWEFSDTADLDVNGEPDLGWTWSKPAIARIAIYNSSAENEPDDIFVAFFGGGWDENEADETGLYIYGVDLEDGTVLVKEYIGVDVPGGVTALDSDNDGFHDRIYFGDSDGGVWRIKYPPPTDEDATGPEAGRLADGRPGVLTQIFDFRTAFPGFADRQEFFTRPVPVPALFDGAEYTWALAMGSGDRANLETEDGSINHFFFLIDHEGDAPLGISSLVEISYADLNGSFDCSGLANEPLVPPYYGWYLTLRENEKVMFDASVIKGYIFFPTFDPSTLTATNPPNQCETASGTQDLEDRAVECRAAGIGRTYKLWYECGLGEETEHNDIITGQEIVDIEGEAEVWSAGTDPKIVPPIEELQMSREHSVTNWRQE